MTDMLSCLLESTLIGARVLQAGQDVGFKEGESRVSGTLYMAGKEHLKLLNEAYNLFSHTNPMHSDVFPSVRQMENEVVSMVASMLGGELSCFLNLCSMHLSAATLSVWMESCFVYGAPLEPIQHHIYDMRGH